MDKKVLRITAILMTVIMVASGCGQAGEVAETTPEPTEEAFKAIEAPGFEKTVVRAERIKNGERYVHGEEGYYLLADDGLVSRRKAQRGGTCWVHAASTSMESAALMKGKEISVDPYEIVDYVYEEDKTEGIIPEKINKRDYGGWQEAIVETLSNGFGDMLLTSAIDCNDMSIDEVKEVIKSHGAVANAMSDTNGSRGGFDGYLTQYWPEILNNHEVAIVGWDDHFPKEYFKVTPSGDGAWIVQDSQMNVDYCYMSYDSPMLDSFQFELSDEYSDIAFYDVGMEGEIETGDKTCLANIFHKKGVLGAVGTVICEKDESIEIRIYDEDTGDLLHEQAFKSEYKGYFAITLDKEVPVENYRIEITYDGKAPVEGKEWFDGSVRYKPLINKGESFVKVGDRWLDLALKKTKKALGIDFTPHNACIKGIYI